MACSASPEVLAVAARVAVSNIGDVRANAALPSQWHANGTSPPMPGTP